MKVGNLRSRSKIEEMEVNANLDSEGVLFCLNV